MASDITLNALVNDLDQLVQTYDVLGQKTSIMLDGKGEQIEQVLANLNSITLNLKTKPTYYLASYKTSIH